LKLKHPETRGILGRVLKARQSLILSYEKSRVVVGFKTDPRFIKFVPH